MVVNVQAMTFNGLVLKQSFGLLVVGLIPWDLNPTRDEIANLP